MSSYYGEMLITLVFIFMLNGYSTLSESLSCIYTDVRNLDIILGISSIFFYLISLIILIKYIKIGVFYKILPWIGLIYVGVGTDDKPVYLKPTDDKPVYLKPVGALASTGLGCFITIYYCILFLFRLLKLTFGGLSRQRQVQHPGYRSIELTTIHIQQQRHSDDPVLKEERPFISQLCAGGFMPWGDVKDMILCIVNGVVAMGSWVLGTRYCCTDQLIGGMVMLITSNIFFALLWYQYVEEEELQGGVLPPPPLLFQVQVLISESLPAADQA